jgi:RNA polymerase sigma-70 factor (ECF subfamily)
MHVPATISRMPPERERALVAEARLDGGAFEELYDFYLPRIYGFIYRRIREQSVAEDLTATTFERALKAVHRTAFRNEPFGGWLYRVASNAVVDHARHGRRLVPLHGYGPGDRHFGREAGADPAADAFAAAIERDELRRALERLPEAHRRVLVLRFLDDLEPEELSAVLGCSRGTLAVKVHRAVRALESALARESRDAA